MKGGPALFAIFVLAAGGVLVIMALPRAVPPSDMPALVIDDDAAEAVYERDARRAARAPDDDDTEALRALYAEHSLAELAGGDTPETARRRIVRFAVLAARYRRSRGDDAVAALRAEAASKLEPALTGELGDAERDALLGTFVTVLERYGAAHEGEVVAPGFVVRTLFVSRWNVAHGLTPTDGMEEAELRAYWGWLALESDAPPERRLQAVEAYARAGGEDAAEARGTLLYRMGRMADAAESFRQAYEEGGSLRLRNHALAALEGGA